VTSEVHFSNGLSKYLNVFVNVESDVRRGKSVVQQILHEMLQFGWCWLCLLL